ncbi:MAG TPA: mitochondrial fission ELM1 family protein [Rhizomicrobium sp.]
MIAPAEISTCWIVTDGNAGGLNQCLGLAEELGLDPVVKRVALRAPWRQLSPFLRWGHAHAFTKNSDSLTPPWPDLLIASGKQSIAAALHVREMGKRDGHRVVTVFIQNPGISPSHFDLVIAPEHDRVVGENVLSTRGALHRITRERLEEGAAKLLPRVSRLQRPYIGVLIGGANASYDLGAEEIAKLADALKRAARENGGSLLITPSRRTGEGNVALLKSALKDTPSFIWDGKGDNPYFGLLGLADHLVVTNDSVSMVSEAVATGKPVHVFALPGKAGRSRKSRKFARFHADMAEAGWTHPFEGKADSYARPSAPRETARAADAVRATLRRLTIRHR